MTIEEAPYRFGDLLALARVDWVRQMASVLNEHGYPDFRASDTSVVRLLRRRNTATIGEIGSRLGVTRQAARKVVTALARRGLVAEARDVRDARKVNVMLTDAGHAYADAVVDTVRQLNRALAVRVAEVDLASADAALRAAIVDPATRALADRIPRPNGIQC
jgi:DNA-binding MarR family transcriptional regulator